MLFVYYHKPGLDVGRWVGRGQGELVELVGDVAPVFCFGECDEDRFVVGVVAAGLCLPIGGQGVAVVGVELVLGFGHELMHGVVLLGGGGAFGGPLSPAAGEIALTLGLMIEPTVNIVDASSMK